MTESRGAPTHNAFSHFRAEEATIVDVDREKWVVKVVTKHTAKDVPNVQLLSPYHHYINGEGFAVMPEVGAVCIMAFPSDDTPPFILGFKGVASQTNVESAGGETQETYSFRSRRPKLNPGDIAITTRDENFLILRRGGVVQIGATALSQTVYLPIRNYIKHFCENYEVNTLGGNMEWRVNRVENDPSGNAPCTFDFQMNEFAQDAKASVRATFYPGSNDNPKPVWQFVIAPQGIDRSDGTYTGEVYTIGVAIDGTTTEFIGANRKTTVQGDDELHISGKRLVKTGGDHTIQASGKAIMKASNAAIVDGSQVQLCEGARSAVLLGDKFIQLLASSQWIVSGTTASLSPASAAALRQAMSRKVFTK